MVADALSIFVRADQVCFCEFGHMLRQNGRRDPERTSDLHSVHTFAVFCHEVKNPNPHGIGKRAKKTVDFSVRDAQDFLCPRASFSRQLCVLPLPRRDAF